MIRPLTILFLLTLLCYNSKAQSFRLDENQKKVSIPFKTYHNLILLNIRVNEVLDLTFLLDSGVETALLCEPMMAALLRLEARRKVRVKGLGADEPIVAELANGVDFVLPGATGTNLNLLILPEGAFPASEMFGQEIHGLIGYDLFKDFVVRIDYVRKMIDLYDPAQFKPPRKYQRIPLEINNKKAFINLDVKLTREDSTILKGLFFLDSGSSQAISIFGQENDDLLVPQPNMDTFLGTGLSGSIFGQLAKVSKVQLGSLSMNQVLAAFPDSSSIRHMNRTDERIGSIGAEILKRFTVYIDYSGGQLYLRRNANYYKSYYYNRSGVEISAMAPRYDQYIIKYVRPKSPAAVAGLQQGDILRRINGLSATGLHIHEIYEILNLRPGKRVKMVLTREQTNFKTGFKIVENL